VSVAPFSFARPLSNYLQRSSRDRRLHTAYRSNARRLVCSKPCSERNSMLGYDRLLGQNAQVWFLLYISPPETYSNEQSCHSSEQVWFLLYISPPETYSNEQSSVIPQSRCGSYSTFRPLKRTVMNRVQSFLRGVVSVNTSSVLFSVSVRLQSR